MPKTVGFVGFSESGKTTLATRVAAELTRRGFRVAALKDAHHGFDTVSYTHLTLPTTSRV